MGTYTVDTDAGDGNSRDSQAICTGTLILDGVNYWDLVLTRDAKEGHVIQTAPLGLRATGFLRQR